MFKIYIYLRNKNNNCEFITYYKRTYLIYFYFRRTLQLNITILNFYLSLNEIEIIL